MYRFVPYPHRSVAVIIYSMPTPDDSPLEDVCTTPIIPAKAGIQRGGATGSDSENQRSQLLAEVMQTSLAGADSAEIAP